MLSNIHPKYILKVQPKEGTLFNPLHNEIDGLVATIIDLNVGERGLFVVNVDNGWQQDWVKISTSTVLDVTVNDNGNVILTTRNTIYTFNKIIEM